MDPARLEKLRLADPVTYLAIVASGAAAQQIFGARIRAVLAELEAVVAGRDPRRLTGQDADRFMRLQTAALRLGQQARDYAERDLAARLDPPDAYPEPVGSQRKPELGA